MVRTFRAVVARGKASAAVLLVAIGLLNFHVPHFLLESPRHFDGAALVLMAVLVVNLVCSVTAAIGMIRGANWGWLLGLATATVGLALYVAQETVGLPGLPKNWWEPSRLLTLILEIWYLSAAYFNLVAAEPTE